MTAIDINKDKNVNSDFDGNGNANIVCINKDRNTSIDNSISIVDINKDKNISNRFNKAVVDKIDKNIRK